MDAFATFLDFIFNKPHPIGKKVILVLFILLSIIVINDITGFSEYTYRAKKIEVIEKLNRIISDTLNTKEARQFASKELSAVLQQERIYDRLFQNDPNSSQIDHSNNTTAKENTTPISSVFIVLIIILSGGIYLNYALLNMVIVVKDKNMWNWKDLYRYIVVFFIKIYFNIPNPCPILYLCFS